MTVEATLETPAREPVDSRSGAALPVLFTATAFTGAALLFLVEPLVAKLLLPSYGGAATVWATSTLFFQVVLLVAYVFVHLTSRLGHRRQPVSQLPLVLVALVVLPLTLPSDAAPDGASPVLWLLRTLVLMVGLPFAVLATTGPLLQRWYSWTDAPRAHDPYFLYAASNVGSFVGLLAYPFLVEPHLSLATQRTLWSWAFAGFVLLVAACGAVVAARGRDPRLSRARTEVVRPSRGRVLRWVGLAFLPSSLMLGVTTHISTDVAAIPLLWVVPLAVYLATMVAAFSGDRRVAPARAVQCAAFLGIFTAVGSMMSTTIGVPAAVTLDLLMLLVVGYAAHAILAADRPSTEHLTLFFVAVSVGGALGGLLNGVLAPQLLDRPLEFPFVLALVPFLMLAVGGSRVIAGVLCVLVMAGVLVADIKAAGPVLDRSRTFYGSYAVGDSSGLHTLSHGTTLHGVQMTDPALRREPTTYYARSGPLGDVFGTADGRFGDVAAVGLGAGTVAAYGEPGQRMTFVEIDPEVIRIARDPRLFTFLRDSKADVRTVAGDGRLQVAAMPAESLDLIVLDAFSSDSIPVHLLTREAMRTYADRLRPGGVLAVHISNRVFDLRPVLADASDALGWRAVHRFGGGRDEVNGMAAHWVVLTTDDAYAESLADLPGWKDLPGADDVAWTDDYSSILDVLK